MARNRPPKSVRDKTKGNGSTGPKPENPSDDRKKYSGHN